MRPLTAVYFKDTCTVPGYTGRRFQTDAHYRVGLSKLDEGTFVVVERVAGDQKALIVPLGNVAALVPADDTTPSESVDITPHASLLEAPKNKGGRPRKVPA